MVLVGPSGCGKTTLLRWIGGLENVTGGRILIGDRDVTSLQPSARDLAMVFQNYALYPHMTVRKNLGYGLRVRKTPRKEVARRVDEAAKLLRLEGLLDRRPGQLSGGQQQRVAMGRAIVREPAAFLMDEPLSNLDAKLRVATRGEILKLQRRLGTTTVYVTHDQVEAMTMGERVAVMRGGVIQQLGTPHQLYEDPRNVFVASFIGSPPMNLVPAPTRRCRQRSASRPASGRSTSGSRTVRETSIRFSAQGRERRVSRRRAARPRVRPRRAADREASRPEHRIDASERIATFAVPRAERLPLRRRDRGTRQLSSAAVAAPPARS